VIGSNNDGTWNEIGTSLDITIKAKIWKSKGAFFLYGFIVIVLVYIIIAIRTRNVKRLKQHLRERDLYAKEIDIQKELLTLKNKNITDSINYAKRIQESLRPSNKVFKKILPGSFVFHEPKDIVSGDFYWINDSNDKVFLAAVDCTGHGVPGAFMSIIGFELFRRITNQGQVDPGKILTHLNHDFEEIFSDVEDITMRDGMDIALCVFDKKSKVLSFAGAFNPMYIIRDNKLIEFKGNRFSIGLDETESNDQIFDTHEVTIHPNDVIYIFTDGYADQFGGTAGKKFKYRRFRHLLLSIHKLPFDQQANQLDQSLKNWKGNYDQVDDILVIGADFNTYL
jgi:serine phosphatase RsbU (regulator of sigma subunit)